ncbi:hypothetical protein F5Y18DRAFT_400255 [Xylariaceae sp. FL1019]|nr:hypothetical protein F5Y18DRAFT_400255 [Xylariaceae sp. FL1019]
MILEFVLSFCFLFSILHPFFFLSLSSFLFSFFPFFFSFQGSFSVADFCLLRAAPFFFSTFFSSTGLEQSTCSLSIRSGATELPWPWPGVQW